MNKPKASPKRKAPEVGVTYQASTGKHYYTDANTNIWKKRDISKERARTIVGDRPLQSGRALTKGDTQITTYGSSSRWVTNKTRARPKAKS
jgi:hypothetical protein